MSGMRSLFIVVLSSMPAFEAGASPPEHLRRYSEGPLEAADFRAAVPDPRPVENGIRLQALTWVDIGYNVRYETLSSTRSTTLTVTSIDVYAVVDQSRSWNNRETDSELLDHEQGHFDLAAIYARRFQMELDRRLIEDRGIKTVGADENEAANALRREVDQQLQSIMDRMTKAHEQYDLATAHGLRGDAQQRERKKQLEELVRLADELAKLRR